MIEQSIPARFAAQVGSHPARLAVAAGARRLTYAELDRLAGHLAGLILRGLGPGEEPVALLLEPGVLIVAAILGVLKAGKIYVALDPASPDAHAAEMLDDSQARLVLTSSQHHARARELARRGQLVLDADAAGDTPGDAALSLPRVEADTGALILYTSGSTGRPKGVLHNHRNILVEARQFASAAHIRPQDRLALTHPCAFASSVRSIYGALLNGAALLVFDPAAEASSALAPWLRESGITIWHTLPTTFRRAFDGAPPDLTVPSLRLLRLGGEAMHREDVARVWPRCAPGCVLLHAIGPTETLLLCQFLVPRDWHGDGNVPVGHVVAGKEVLLLDEAGRAVVPGQIGEIAVRSKYLAVGYWRRPELTREAFRPDPEGSDARIYLTGDLGLMSPDGCLTHMGRKDSQTKIRGYRVETGEVEVALLGLPSIAGAVVVAQVVGGGEQRLVAYVVPAPGVAPTVSELRHALIRALPGYMVPSAFVFVDGFPLLPNGKIDRQQLPAPGRERPPIDVADVPPRTPIEAELARLWAEVLDVEHVGIHDPFLELGGHSLIAARLLARVSQTFRLEVSLHGLLTASTVAHMAEVIVQWYAKTHPDAIADLLAEIEDAADTALSPSPPPDPPPTSGG